MIARLNRNLSRLLNWLKESGGPVMTVEEKAGQKSWLDLQMRLEIA